MIFNLFINFLLLIAGSLFVFLPIVSLSTIPYIGPEIASTLNTMVGLWNSFVLTFPYADIAMKVLMYVILPFELLLLVGKFFLGNRLHVSNTNIN